MLLSIHALEKMRALDHETKTYQIDWDNLKDGTALELKLGSIWPSNMN